MFKFQLSPATIIAQVVSALQEKMIDVFDCSSINVASDTRLNAVVFNYKEKEYTIVVYSSTSITVSFYDSKADLCGCRVYTSIEECFIDLNEIVKLQAEVRDERITIPARTEAVIIKEWILIPDKQVDMSPLEPENRSSYNKYPAGA